MSYHDHNLCSNGHQSFKPCLFVSAMMTNHDVYYANKDKSSLSIFVVLDTPRQAGSIVFL